MWQKIKKGLQVLAIIGIVYFMYKMFFVHYPNKDTEKMLANIIGMFICSRIFIDNSED